MRTLLFKATRILMITAFAASLLYSGLNTLRSLDGAGPGGEPTPSGATAPAQGDR